MQIVYKYFEVRTVKIYPEIREMPKCQFPHWTFWGNLVSRYGCRFLDSFLECVVLFFKPVHGGEKKRSAASPERPSQDSRLRAPHIEESKPVVVLKKRLLPYWRILIETEKKTSVNGSEDCSARWPSAEATIILPFVASIPARSPVHLPQHNLDRTFQMLRRFEMIRKWIQWCCTRSRWWWQTSRTAGFGDQAALRWTSQHVRFRSKCSHQSLMLA